MYTEIGLELGFAPAGGRSKGVSEGDAFGTGVPVESGVSVRVGSGLGRVSVAEALGLEVASGADCMAPAQAARKMLDITNSFVIALDLMRIV